MRRGSTPSIGPRSHASGCSAMLPVGYSTRRLHVRGATMPAAARRVRLTTLISAALACTLAAAGQQERDKIADRYKWDLSPLYPSERAWRTAKEAFVAEIPKLGAFKGKLGGSAEQLASALDLANRLSKDYARLAVYASLLSDQDTRVAAYQGMNQEMTQIGAQLAAETAFVEPEILTVDKTTVDGFVAREPRLKVYRLYLDDILRRRAHTLGDAEERLLASASVVAGSPANVYGILSDADFPYPTVTLADGK